MKLVVVFLMVLGALLGTPRPVRAELPPYNPEMMKPDPDVPKAQKFTPVYRGPMTFFTTEFGDTQSVLLRASTTFGFQLQDVIMPFYNEDDKNIASPVLRPMAQFYNNFQPMLVPQEVTSKSIHWSEINENIQSNVFCARIINRSEYSDADEDISSSGMQKSANIEYSQKFYENARKVNAMLGRHTFESITPGYYDWNLPTELNSITDASPYCMQSRKSKTYTEYENPVTQLATFGAGSISVEGTTPPYDIGHEVYDAVRDIWVTVLDQILPMYRVNLTEVSVDGNAQQVCNIGDCNTEEVDGTKYEFVKELDDTRGLTFNYLPEEIAQNRAKTDPAERAAQQVYQYAVFGITTADLAGVELYGEDRQKDNLHATNALLNALDRSAEMACTSVPEEILEKYTVSLAAPKEQELTKEQREKMSPAQLAAALKAAKEKAAKAAIPINQTCKPPEEEEACEGEPDTWDEIKQKLSKSINDVCTKYQSNLPISHDQCVGMMNEIFNIEVRNDNTMNPDLGGSYACEENEAGAAGPFQIKLESKNLTMCTEEQMDDDLAACKTNEEQLSRCVTEDAAEIAMRIILRFSKCSNAYRIGTTEELYRAVCDYGTGQCVPQPHLNNQTYCEDVFNAAGIPIPPNSCPATSPTP